MYLSKLQLLGFKSFPEKTELKFNRGITCIVGPNGCGKTNLLDAIRWVLGETRMSVLRGSRLEEIIFAGTRDYKPLGMAEVALSFDNHDHTVPSGYNEIDVTRRLFRSGDSEFSINRTPCRLKDITDMFLDTGLGPGAYSVIEQSMVDVLLSDKTEERRFLFEEAAGITKYKQRKRQALRKLEATESDLLRLQDVLTEVGSQVSMLKRQVSKAERYKSLNEEIKRIGISLSSAEWTALSRNEDQLSKQLEGLKIEGETNLGKQREWELQREKIALERTECDRHARDVQSELDESIGKCHRLENEISVLNEKLRNASVSFSQAGSDIDNLVKRQESLEQELKDNDGDRREVTGSISDLNGRLTSAESELEARLADCNRLRQLAEERQEQADALMENLTGRRESQLTLDLRYTADTEKLAEVKTDINRLAGRIEELSAEQSEVASEIKKIEATLTAKNAGISGIESAISDLEAEIEKLDAEKQQQIGKLEKITARLEFLEKVISDYEGYGEGTAAIGRLKDAIPGVIDTVANLVESDGEHSPLIQAVLGEYAGYFVVADDDSAAAVLDHVRAEKLGRVGLIVKSYVSDPVPPTSSDTLAGCTPVRSLVSGEDDLSGLFDFLFDGHYLLNPGATAPVKQNPSAAFWNQDGEVVASGGRVRSAGSQEVVLVGRKRELESLASQRQGSIDKIARTNHDKVEKTKRRDNQLAELETLRDEVSVLRTRSTELNIRNSNLEYELAELRDRKSEKDHIRKELAGSIDAISRDKCDLTKVVDDLQASRSQIESELTDIRDKLQVAEDDYTASDKENSRLKLELVGLEGQLSTLRSNRSRLDELKNDIIETIGLRTGQQSELLTVSAESKRTVRENETELKSEYARTEEKRAEAVHISTAVSELDAKIKKMDGELKILRREETTTLEKTHELDLELSSVRSRQSNMIEDSVEHYEFDPSTSSLEVKLSDDQLADLSEQLATLRRRLDSLGPVNMLALDEYDEQSKRYHFLSEQVSDLTTAKEDLNSTISKINMTAKRLFTETLELVRSNFQDVFKELFEGGSADVKLEEGVDALEANIIITARPRGKKILSIQQLSGGERALTSISLLFALYLVKPSPFCILDEVDAPLDDANIGRFLKMIKRFSEGTQFIIITHNKLTMEAADVLYGVTMHQHGVSQIVSVNLNSAEERDALLGEASVEEPQAEEAVEIE